MTLAELSLETKGRSTAAFEKASARSEHHGPSMPVPPEERARRIRELYGSPMDFEDHKIYDQELLDAMFEVPISQRTSELMETVEHFRFRELQPASEPVTPLVIFDRGPARPLPRRI
ncbi:MAG: hypothetical protein UU21_C0017G0002 [Candidatus Levybacteria bacterium GW2011_GWA2_40_8]|nr:MAG: hypothetical protein UU21_C0017G0002 [Candidatus Levybacteria bacterium GW2011_GWA2_40_8]